ncbi:MAG: hypothetical protein LBM59_06750 [Ruminococcus sp.]|jgi:uncharacterized membrane protein YkgB|nr:hypothetical protein [Ruminococcus sp.]
MKICQVCFDNAPVIKSGGKFYCKNCAIESEVLKDSFYGKNFAASPGSVYAVSALIQILIIVAAYIIDSEDPLITLFWGIVAAVIAAAGISFFTAPKLLLKYKIMNFLISPAVLMLLLTLWLFGGYIFHGTIPFPKQG